MVLIPVIVFIIGLAVAILLTDFALQRFPVGLELSEDQCLDQLER